MGREGADDGGGLLEGFRELGGHTDAGVKRDPLQVEAVHPLALDLLGDLGVVRPDPNFQVASREQLGERGAPAARAEDRHVATRGLHRLFSSGSASARAPAPRRAGISSPRRSRPIFARWVK